MKDSETYTLFTVHFTLPKWTSETDVYFHCSFHLTKMNRWKHHIYSLRFSPQKKGAKIYSLFISPQKIVNFIIHCHFTAYKLFTGISPHFQYSSQKNPPTRVGGCHCWRTGLEGPRTQGALGGYRRASSRGYLFYTIIWIRRTAKIARVLPCIYERNFLARTVPYVVDFRAIRHT
jgi:hypothetical protein